MGQLSTAQTANQYDAIVSYRAKRGLDTLPGDGGGIPFAAPSITFLESHRCAFIANR